MTDKFSLIKRLNTDEVIEESPLANGIKYQQYDIEVETEIKSISVPLKEAEAFEFALNEQKITNRTLKILLRKHRGVRG